MVKDMKRLLAIISTGLILAAANSLLFADEPVYKYHHVKVGCGDTLWDIASRSAAQDEDVREVVFRICKVNELNDKHVYPGQVLKVPVAIQNADEFILAAK